MKLQGQRVKVTASLNIDLTASSSDFDKMLLIAGFSERTANQLRRIWQEAGTPASWTITPYDIRILSQAMAETGDKALVELARSYVGFDWSGRSIYEVLRYSDDTPDELAENNDWQDAIITGLLIVRELLDIKRKIERFVNMAGQQYVGKEHG